MNERQVTVAEAEELASTLACPFLETSAKSGVNVHDAFFTVVREIRRLRPKPATLLPGAAEKGKRCVLL